MAKKKETTKEIIMRNRVKVKNLNEAKEVKFQEVFGHEGPMVGYSIDGTTITLENGITAEFTKTVEDIEGFELLKDIKIQVVCEAKEIEFEIEWTRDHGTVWIVQRLLNNLISVPRVSGGAKGLSIEDKEKLQAEIAKYKEMKKAQK